MCFFLASRQVILASRQANFGEPPIWFHRGNLGRGGDRDGVGSSNYLTSSTSSEFNLLRQDFTHRNFSPLRQVPPDFQWMASFPETRINTLLLNRIFSGKTSQFSRVGSGALRRSISLWFLRFGSQKPRPRRAMLLA